jgi:hypothetical protein
MPPGGPPGTPPTPPTPSTPSGEVHHDEVRFADDVVPRALVLRVIAGTVIISVVLCIIAYLLYRLRMKELRPEGLPPTSEVGIPHPVAAVRQDLFERPRARPGHNQAQRRRLSGYSWVDRDNGIIAIPVEQAIELRLARPQKGTEP